MAKREKQPAKRLQPSRSVKNKNTTLKKQKTVKSNTGTKLVFQDSTTVKRLGTPNSTAAKIRKETVTYRKGNPSTLITQVVFGRGIPSPDTHRPPDYKGILNKIKRGEEVSEETPKFNSRTVSSFLEQNKKSYQTFVKHKLQVEIQRLRNEVKHPIQLIGGMSLQYALKLETTFYWKQLQTWKNDYTSKGTEIYNETISFTRKVEALTATLSEIVGMHAKLAEILRLRAVIAAKVNKLAWNTCEIPKTDLRKTEFGRELDEKCPELLVMIFT